MIDLGDMMEEAAEKYSLSDITKRLGITKLDILQRFEEEFLDNFYEFNLAAPDEEDDD